MRPIRLNLFNQADVPLCWRESQQEERRGTEGARQDMEQRGGGGGVHGSLVLSRVHRAGICLDMAGLWK